MPIFDFSAISRSSTPIASRIWRSSGPENSVRGEISGIGGRVAQRRRIVDLRRRAGGGAMSASRSIGVTGIGTPSGNSSMVVLLALRRIHQRRVREVEPAMHRLEARRIVEPGDRNRLGAVDVADAAVRAPDVLEARRRRHLEQLVVRVARQHVAVGASPAAPPSGRARRARSTSRCASRGARSAAAGGGASMPTPPRRTRGDRGSAAGAEPAARGRRDGAAELHVALAARRVDHEVRREAQDRVAQLAAARRAAPATAPR